MSMYLLQQQVNSMSMYLLQQQVNSIRACPCTCYNNRWTACACTCQYHRLTVNATIPVVTNAHAAAKDSPLIYQNSDTKVLPSTDTHQLSPLNPHQSHEQHFTQALTNVCDLPIKLKINWKQTYRSKIQFSFWLLLYISHDLESRERSSKPVWKLQTWSSVEVLIKQFLNTLIKGLY